MALVPFNRQNLLAYKPVTNLLDDFFGNAWRPMQSLLNESFKLDVREELLHYTIEAEVPGVQKKDICINFRNGTLTISVSHKKATEEEDTRYIHLERRRSSTQRSIYLEDATGFGITAALTDGVLHIYVPKKEETAKSTHIDIR